MENEIIYMMDVPINWMIDRPCARAYMVHSSEVALDDDRPFRARSEHWGKPGLVAVAVKGCVAVLVPAQLGPPCPLAAHLHCLVWLLAEAREATQAPAAADVELLPRGRCQHGIAGVEMLQQWQLMEPYPSETWELVIIIERIPMMIVIENFLEVVAGKDVECLKSW